MTSGEFKSILLPCYRRMYATAFSILRDVDDASDAVQDTISALWQKHESLEVPENPEAFCCRSVRNNCIDHLRSNAKRYFDNIGNLGDLASATQTDGNASLHTIQAYIDKLLSGFKEKQKKILMLSFYSQLTNDEISKITGESYENVRVIISRGRKKLKEYLENEIR